MCVCFFFLMIRRPPRSTRTDTLFPYTTLFRSQALLVPQAVFTATATGGDFHRNLPLPCRFPAKAMERGCPGRHPDSLDHVRREARQRIITIRPFGEHLALAQFDGVLPRPPPVATGLLRPLPRCDHRLDEIEAIIGSPAGPGGTVLIAYLGRRPLLTC